MACFGCKRKAGRLGAELVLLGACRRWLATCVADLFTNREGQTYECRYRHRP